MSADAAPWRAALQALAEREDMLGKGFLGVALVIARKARTEGLPLDPQSMLAKGGAQVAGASGSRVKHILAEHGVTRRLSSEGGRTSRGGPAKMQALVAFLNDLACDDRVDADAIERFWVEKVREFFARKPFVLTLDPAASVRQAIVTLIRAAEARQREMAGATIVGTLVQHLIGATIEIALDAPGGTIAQHGASVSDQPGRDRAGRGGDFEIGDTIVHVTTMPGALLIEKCADNLAAGKRPLIVTGRARLSAADGQIEDAGLGERVDVIDYEGFVAANVFQIGGFTAAGRRDAIAAIIARYNMIVDRVEGDASLRIEWR